MAYPMQGWQQPYGGYYPPMQDQLAQLRSQPYMPQQPAQQAPAQNGGGIIWVQGEAAAKSYPVSPGSGVLLMDSESLTFYLKSADASGMPSMRIFDYTERTAPRQAEPSVQSSEYVTREDFNVLVARVDALTKKPNRKKEDAVDEQPAV
jgi:hypothetical protein